MGDFGRAMEIIGPEDNDTLAQVAVICLMQALCVAPSAAERREWWRKCKTVVGWEQRRQREAGRAALREREEG